MLTRSHATRPSAFVTVLALLAGAAVATSASAATKRRTTPSTTIAPAVPTTVKGTKGISPATRDAQGLYKPQGAPPPPAVDFSDGGRITAFPAGQLVTMLIIGSDARPKEEPTRTRSDSMHLLVWNPVTKKGTLLGIPRDTWVTVGRSKAKINSVLSAAGPTALVGAVRDLTGVPVEHYVLTGFVGFTSMINDVGGFNVEIPRMNDKLSGAQFTGGWYKVNGDAALAIARNRHDAPAGDFGRSKNQGVLLLAMLTQMRSGTTSPADLVRLLGTFSKYGRTDLSTAQLLDFALLARGIDPSQLANIVVPARNAKAGKAAIVLVEPAAAALFERIRTTGSP